MAIVRKYQNNFTTGVLSPAAYSRVDLDKYASGCAELVNGVVLAHGGVTKRPGTMKVDELPGAGLLIPFTYSVEQTCVLAFYDNGPIKGTYMRIYTEGGVVSSDGYEIQVKTPYRFSDLSKIKFAQSADTLFLVHPDYPVYKLVRHSFTSWKFSPLEFSPPIQPPTGLEAVASGFTDASGTYVATTADYCVSAVNLKEQESMPSEEATADTLSTWPTGARVTLKWDAVAGAVRYEVYKNTRGYYTWLGSTKDTEFTDDNIEGDDSLGPKDYRNPFNNIPAPILSEINMGEVTDETDLDYTEAQWCTAYADAFGTVGPSDAVQLRSGKYQGTKVRMLYHETAHKYIVYGRTEGTTEWSAFVYTPSELPSISPVAFTQPPIPFTYSGAVNPKYEAESQFVIACLDSQGEPSVSSGVATVLYPEANNMVFTLRWNLVEEASGYRVYHRHRRTDGAFGDWGYNDFPDKMQVGAGVRVGEEDGVESPNLPYIEIDFDTLTAQEGTPKDKADNFPGAIGIYQQRLVFGRTDAEPQTVWMSETGSFDSMSVATPMRDDSAITATVDTKQMNEVRHFIALRDMLMLTSGAEFKVTSGNTSSAVTPTAITFPIQSYWGVSDVPPIVSGSSILLVQNSNRHVRDLQYTIQEDGYSGNEISILAEHLFDADIVDWAYQQSPYSTVWVCLANGRLLTLTYMKEHNIWAWSEHESSNGRFLSVSSVREGAEDAVYFLTERDGHFFVEYQVRRNYGDAVEDAFFVDCGLRYSGEPIQQVSGLEHLAGKEIAVLADGSVFVATANTDGTFELPAPASKITAGLPYTMKLTTLDPEIRSENGSTFGDKKSVVRAVVYVRDTRLFEIGPSDSSMVYVKAPMQSVWDAPPPMYTGFLNVNLPGHHRDEATITIIARDPVPCTILGLNKYISIG